MKLGGPGCGAEGAGGPDGVQRGRLGGACREEVRGTVTGDEKRERLVGLITPDMAVTGLMLG